LQALKRDGQSIWLDFIERKLMASGDLARMVEADGICGLTSNPAIFQKAIGGSDQYDADIAAILRDADAEPSALFEAIAIEDIRQASDIMRPVYDRTLGVDGYISLEVSPHLAADTAGTLDSARRLWKAVDRPNLMIKVPGTKEGIPAMQQLIAEGINVNVTLLFAREAYRAVAHAYIDGIAACVKAGGNVTRVASVASFFVSRIDVAIDALVERQFANAADAKERETLTGLLGKVAIANAKLAYQDYLEIFDRSERWQQLVKSSGARAQRLLWASTGTKNPKYRDVVYMEELVGDNTVNTVPPATLDAFRDHGGSNPAIERDVDAARAVITALGKSGISLAAVTDKLLVDGLVLFADADDQLMVAISGKRKQLLQSRIATEQYALGDALKKSVDETLESWRKSGAVRRLWAHDASFWTGGDEARWLDWLEEVDKISSDAVALNAFAAELLQRGFTTALVLGMGGSSLGPEVLSLVFGNAVENAPRGLALRVIDSMDPTQIAAIETTLDFEKTLFIVASKSGSTLEPDMLCRYFYAQATAKLGKTAGTHFVAITDPGSTLGKYASEHGFRRAFDGEPNIGGRYSIYSNFGMVPAALLGLDIVSVLDKAKLMVNSCRPSNPPQQNPGMLLGAIMGMAAKAGRDKLTLIASPKLAPFGSWVEQLVAESTGKHGHGIVPVDAEPIGACEAYGNDRLFVYLRLEGATDPAQEKLAESLAQAGHPVITFSLANVEELLQEFFRWEIATAVAGAALGIHPFDQPDVEAAKIQARALIDAYERDRRLPQQTPLLQERGLDFYSAAKLPANTGIDLMRQYLSQIDAGDYFAILAYLPMLAPHQKALQAMRQKIRDKKQVATCLGFGPRFLHSTGQLYKGGPNSGVFLVLTCDDVRDITVPGSVASFGVVKSAQASGDMAVLVERGHRVLRVHLGPDVAAGLATLAQVVNAALD
jgi:transaldolase/glucose-6-phosphate isomerase